MGDAGSNPAPVSNFKLINMKDVNDIEVVDFVEVPPRKLVNYNKYALIDIESGLLYDKETLRVVGHDNY
jgi:hypothetical protein